MLFPVSVTVSMAERMYSLELPAPLRTSCYGEPLAVSASLRAGWSEVLLWVPERELPAVVPQAHLPGREFRGAGFWFFDMCLQTDWLDVGEHLQISRTSVISVVLEHAPRYLGYLHTQTPRMLTLQSARSYLYFLHQSSYGLTICIFSIIETILIARDKHRWAECKRDCFGKPSWHGSTISTQWVVPFILRCKYSPPRAVAVQGGIGLKLHDSWCLVLLNIVAKTSLKISTIGGLSWK